MGSRQRAKPRTTSPWSLLLLPLALLVLFGAGSAAAQENEDCLMCHEESDLLGERDGKEISVFVSPKRYAASVHGEIGCVMCHQDLAGEELPHDEELELVDCSLCHDEVAEEQRRSLHGIAEAKGDPLAPSCAHCHGTHGIRRHDDPLSLTAVTNVPALCGECHHEGSPVSRTHDIPQDRILENYSLSIHGEGLFQKGLTVTAVCTSCHTAHKILDHTDPESSIHADNVPRPAPSATPRSSRSIAR